MRFGASVARELIYNKIQNIYNGLEESAKNTFNLWHENPKIPLYLGDDLKEVSRDLEVLSIALFEVESMERDSRELMRLRTSLKNFKELFNDLA